MSDEWEQMQDDEERAYLRDMSDSDNDRTRKINTQHITKEHISNEQTSEPTSI